MQLATTWTHSSKSQRFTKQGPPPERVGAFFVCDLGEWAMSDRQKPKAWPKGGQTRP